MNDEEFVRAFERCEIPNASFHHRDHVRLAWIYLRHCGPERAEAEISISIRRYAAHNGASHKYHETITLAWMRLVAQAMQQAPAGATFEDLAERFPKLLDKASLSEFYSDELLASDAARTSWVEPDLQPLK